jgi:PadR family transcriptional regulator, regulatory protein PadR
VGLPILCVTQYCRFDMVEDELLATLRQELRRGSVVLVCLLALREPDYGYALVSILGTAGVEIDANTLYPLLRRLERQGLVTSEWVTEDPRPRKYYRTTDAGIEVAGLLLDDWSAISRSIDHFRGGGHT